LTGPKRTPTQREHDLERIATLYLKGKRQVDIAAELGIAQSQVSYDLKEIHARWRKSALVDINEVKQRELARIDELERTYWDAWNRSMGETVKTTTSKSDKDGGKASITKEQQVGNPAYLSGVQWCIEQRCKIFGIYEATKITVDWRKELEEQGYDAGSIFEQMVNAYRAAIIADADGANDR
jgi:hypothetical protein